jgi:hypothetical protein
MKSDNIDMSRGYPVPDWVYRVDSPPEVDPEPLVQLTATRSRDGLLLALAVLVIVALAGYAIGRAS